MILGVAAVPLVLIVLVVVLGAAVQSMVGLGLNLVSAPIVTLLEPSLVPELPLVLAVILPGLTLAHSRAEIDWRGLGWLMPSRVPGTVLGVLLLGWISTRTLGIAVGVMVLLAVLLTARAIELPMTRSSLSTAGFVAGVAGTTTSIGGPPVALLYQHRPPQEIRSTLAVFFTLGALVSLTAIGIGGGLEWRAVVLGVVLAPVLLLGTLVGVRLQGIFPDRATRFAVLGICAASALVLLVRSLG
jgi:uncharacterized membrane protein YfcA